LGLHIEYGVFWKKKISNWGFLFLKESEFVPKYLGQNHGFSGVK
jgi:hypothetical protein